MRTTSYGSTPDQVGDLFLPSVPSAPLVCMFHGGFWRMPYGRSELTPIARDLCERGYAVWNLEYRRVGSGGHPWPATFSDVDASLAYLPHLQAAEPQLDLTRLVLVGHSAGGHLAFWAAARAQRAPHGVRPAAAIGLAPLLDLLAVHSAGLGNNAVEAFLGGPPTAVPDRYREGSPRALLPIGVRQFVIHGDADMDVPLHLSRNYESAAQEAGDQVTCIALPGVDHMSFLDPQGEAHRALCACLAQVCGRDDVLANRPRAGAT
jgi:acetyl esterase/lipase